MDISLTLSFLKHLPTHLPRSIVPIIICPAERTYICGKAAWQHAAGATGATCYSRRLIPLIYLPPSFRFRPAERNLSSLANHSMPSDQIMYLYFMHALSKPQYAQMRSNRRPPRPTSANVCWRCRHAGGPSIQVRLLPLWTYDEQIFRIPHLFTCLLPFLPNITVPS